MSAPVPRRRRPSVDRYLKEAAKHGLRITSIKIGVDGSIELLTTDSAPAVIDSFAQRKAERDARRAQRDR